AVELARDRQDLHEALVDAHDRAQAQVPGAGVGAQVRDLDLGGAGDEVADRVAGVARGQRDQDHAGHHRGQRQADHQPHHRLAPERALRGLVGHHSGPKKLLSTASLAAPSALSTRKTSGWRPLTESGPATVTGTLSTCWGAACTASRPAPWSVIPAGAPSRTIR